MRFPIAASLALMLAWSMQCVAQRPAAEGAPPQQPVRKELELSDYLYLAAFAGVLLLGAVGIAVASRWFRATRESEVSASDQLSEFRRLNEQGELSDEEFQKIKNLLKDKIRSEVGFATPAAPKNAVHDSSAEKRTPNQEYDRNDAPDDAN